MMENMTNHENFNKENAYKTISQNGTELTLTSDAVSNIHAGILAKRPSASETHSSRQLFPFFESSPNKKNKPEPANAIDNRFNEINTDINDASIHSSLTAAKLEMNSFNRKQDLLKIRNLANQKKHDRLNQLKSEKYSDNNSKAIKKKWRDMGGKENELVSSNIKFFRVIDDIYVPVINNDKLPYQNKETKVLAKGDTLLLMADYRKKYSLSNLWFSATEKEAVTLIDTILSSASTNEKHAIIYQCAADIHYSSVLLEKESGKQFKLWSCGSVLDDTDIKENECSRYVEAIISALAKSTNISSGCTLYFSYPSRQADALNCFLFALSSCKHFLLNENISINKIYDHKDTIHALKEIENLPESYAVSKKRANEIEINCVSVVLPPEMMKLTQSTNTIIGYANYLKNTENREEFLAKVREKCFVTDNHSVFNPEIRAIKNLQLAFKKYTKLELLSLFEQTFTPEELNELRLIQKFPTNQEEFEKILMIACKYEYFLLAENLLSLDSYHSEIQKTALQTLINNKTSDPTALETILKQSDELINEYESKITI